MLKVQENQISKYKFAVVSGKGLVINPSKEDLESESTFLISNPRPLSFEDYIEFFKDELGEDAALYMQSFPARRLVAMGVNPKLWEWKTYSEVFGAENPMRFSAKSKETCSIHVKPNTEEEAKDWKECSMHCHGRKVELAPKHRYDRFPVLKDQVSKYFPGVRQPSVEFIYDDAESRDALINLDVGLNQMLVGPTGCGKTYGAEEYFLRLGLPVFTVPCTRDTTHKSLFGSTGLENGNTYFKRGLVTEAIGHYGVIILDEVTAIDPSRGLDMNPLLENRDILIDAKGLSNMIVHNHGFSHVVGTSNTGGKKSGSRAYKNASVQDLAWRDRWQFTECHYKDIEVERKKIYATMLSMGMNPDTFSQEQRELVDRHIDDLLKLVDGWREQFVEGTLQTPLSSRALVAFTKYWLATSCIYTAYEQTIIPRFEENEQLAIIESINDEVQSFQWNVYSPQVS